MKSKSTCRAKRKANTSPKQNDSAEPKRSGGRSKAKRIHVDNATEDVAVEDAKPVIAEELDARKTQSPSPGSRGARVGYPAGVRRPMVLDLGYLKSNGTLDQERKTKEEKGQNRRRKQEEYKSISSQITEYMFVGGLEAAQDEEQLQEKGITHILNCAGTPSTVLPTDSYIRCSLEIKDTATEDIARCFYNAIEFIDRARSDGGKVLVHCNKGISRSPTVAMAYLTCCEKLSCDESLHKVREARPVVNEFAIMKLHQQLFRVVLDRDKKTPLLEVVDLASMKLKVDNPWQDYDDHCYIMPSSSSIRVWFGASSSKALRSASEHAIAQLVKYSSAPSRIKIAELETERCEFWKGVRKLVATESNRYSLGQTGTLTTNN